MTARSIHVTVSANVAPAVAGLNMTAQAAGRLAAAEGALSVHQDLTAAIERTVEAGYVTPKPHGLTNDGMQTLTDLAAICMLTGADKDSRPPDRLLSETSRAFLTALAAAISDAAGEDPVEMVRNTEANLQTAVETARSI